MTNPRKKYLCRDHGYPDCKYETYVGSSKRDHQKRHPPANKMEKNRAAMNENMCPYCDKTLRNQKALINHK